MLKRALAASGIAGVLIGFVIAMASPASAASCIQGAAGCAPATVVSSEDPGMTHNGTDPGMTHNGIDMTHDGVESPDGHCRTVLC